MKRETWLLLLLLLIAGVVSIPAVGAEQEKGAEFIDLDGGSSGVVHFPHRVHQAVVEDCMSCHSDFPQKPGSIDALKADGVLKKKQIMNQHCTACHRRMKAEGKETGPTGCTSCHHKSG
jgi:uncharacterized membrane protein